MGNSRKYPYNTMDGFLEFRGQGGILWTGILKVWGSTYIWNSECLKMLILWTLPLRKWSTTEQCNTDDDCKSAGYRRSINRSGMCWRKPIKLGLYIKFMNFLMMKILEYSVNPGLFGQRAPFWNMLDWVQLLTLQIFLLQCSVTVWSNVKCL